MNILRQSNNIQTIVRLRENEDYISCARINENKKPDKYAKDMHSAAVTLSSKLTVKKICIFNESSFSKIYEARNVCLSFNIEEIKGFYCGIKILINGKVCTNNEIRSHGDNIYEFVISKISDINREVSDSAIKIGGELYFSDSSKYKKHAEAL
jgi:hypothetical protein